METLYEVINQVGESGFVAGFIPDERPTFAVSVRNLIAFTTHMDLSRRDSDSIPSFADVYGTFVYVADLNTPWDCYLLKTSSSQVTSLLWDHTGVRLLAATQEGQVEVYGMLDNLLNKWHRLFHAQFSGEPILSSLWLSVPRKVCLTPDKLDSILYSEKYSITSGSNGNGFGGSFLDGSIVVTATGLLGAVISAPDEPGKAISAIEKISPVRNRVIYADLGYSKDGDYMVVTSGQTLKQPVAVNRVKVHLGGLGRDRAEIVVSGGQSLFLPNMNDHLISAVKFANRMSTEQLLIALQNPDTNASILSLWTLVSEPVVLKPRFQTGTNEVVMNFRWEQTHKIPFNSPIEYFCTLPVPIALPNSSQNQNQNQTHLMTMNQVIQPLIAISLSNGAVHLIRLDGFQQVMNVSTQGESSSLQLKRDPDEQVPDAKQLKLNLNSYPFVSLQFSWSGCLLLCMDVHSQFHVYKIHSSIDASTATSLLELSMMGGLDPWDVMTCLKPNLIDNITDRLSETFARQPPAVQTHYNVRILVIKAALYRLACGGLARTNDHQTLLTLHLVSNALKALLRPSDLSSHDKGPAESLSSLLNSKGEALLDVDKVLLHLEAKEYAVESSLLQSLQQFLQWCADIALKLLSTLPDLRHSRAPGWEVCRDSKAVGTLRELIVLMRIWGLISPACLPCMKTSENLDVLPLLFRLLTRLSVTPHDPDEALIDHGVTREVRPIPWNQQIQTEKNEEAYIWLYAALAFGAIVFFLIFLGMWCQSRKKGQEMSATSNDSFLQNAEKRGSSILDGSLTTSSVQPMSQCDKMSEYPPPSFCSSVLPGGTGKGMNFGGFNLNLHAQQPSGYGQQPVSQQQNQNDTLLSTLNENPRRGSSSRSNSLMQMQSRTDSFPYEEYGMPESERIPLRTRVEDQSPFNSYLHLTPSELVHLDSLDQDESGDGNGQPDSYSMSSNAQTLPMGEKATNPR